MARSAAPPPPVADRHETIEVYDPPPAAWGEPPPGCRWALILNPRDHLRQDGLVWEADGRQLFAPVNTLSGYGMGGVRPPG